MLHIFLRPQNMLWADRVHGALRNTYYLYRGDSGLVCGGFDMMIWFHRPAVFLKESAGFSDSWFVSFIDVVRKHLREYHNYRCLRWWWGGLPQYQFIGLGLGMGCVTMYMCILFSVACVTTDRWGLVLTIKVKIYLHYLFIGVVCPILRLCP